MLPASPFEGTDAPPAGLALPMLLLLWTIPALLVTLQVLEELLRAGMSVARFNFSHGSHEYHQVRVMDPSTVMLPTDNGCRWYSASASTPLVLPAPNRECFVLRRPP